MMDALTPPQSRRTTSCALNSVNVPTHLRPMRKLAALLDIIATIALLTLTLPLLVLLFLARIPSNYLKRRNYGR